MDNCNVFFPVLVRFVTGSWCGMSKYLYFVFILGGTFYSTQILLSSDIFDGFPGRESL